MAGGEKNYDLEVTPTWIVAAVCSIIIILSLLMERALHRLGESMKKRGSSLYEAVLKVKEELMLLGFISILLEVFETSISRICIPIRHLNHMLPCMKKDMGPAFLKHIENDKKYINHCEKKGKEELLSTGAIHQLHIFIFVLAITHVALSVATICLGRYKIGRWKNWEKRLSNKANQTSNSEPKITYVQDVAFIQDRNKPSSTSWLHSFGKQFHYSITEHDYEALRRRFINVNCPSNPQFNFHNYIMDAYDDDFKKVVGISWYLWGFVIVLLLMNVGGWQTLFWITLIPLVLLLAVGTKLEHVIDQLAKGIADKNAAVLGEVDPSAVKADFWFNNPRLLLHFIHFILFQNAFEIAFFFWLWVTYGFRSCIMGKVYFVVPRLIFGVIIQFLCSFSTLPIYAIVTQMGNGSTFKEAIFKKHSEGTAADGEGQMKGRLSDDQPRVTNNGFYTHAGNRSPDEIQLQEAPLVHSVSNSTQATSKLEASQAKEKHIEDNK